jgi:lipopolysaccharide/colanic/teichoic acid biosynthesis glycosyltransferase
VIEAVRHVNPLTTAARTKATDRAATHRSALVLAFAAPIIAELLSGSCPPLLFFVPWIFTLFVLFYGGSAILIHELSVRWNTGWRGVLILGSAFAILHEGLATRAFFDPHWPSLGPMMNHGRLIGVNWIWMVDAIVYHAVFSTALPLLLVYHLFPAHRSVSWLGTRGLWLVGTLFAGTAAVFLDSGQTRYPAPAMHLMASVAAIVLLVVLARVVPAGKPRPPSRSPAPPRWCVALGASAALAMVLQIYAVPLVAPAWFTATLLTAGVLTVGALLVRWSGDRGRLTSAQERGVLTGALGFFAALAFFQELNPARTDNPAGMSMVGACAIIFLYASSKRTGADFSAPVAPLRATAATAASKARPGYTFPFLAGPSRVDNASDVIVGPTAKDSLAQRACERVIAAAALVVTSPIMLALAIVVRRGTPGPVFFVQKRIGLNGKPFAFVKFRTLYADAHQRFPALYDYRYTEEELEHLKFKVTNDPRVTPQGRWMRSSTLDELPNFWNVLRGDMALVGPRPEIPEMLPYYHGDMLLKYAVRPGITGLAQISGRGRLGFYETVALDVRYVKTRSWLLDVKVLLLTAFKIITRDGAF